MEEYFEKFEEQLKAAEEKLDILSDWHIAKGHKGATEITEDCRTAITFLWGEFYQLSKAYKEAEASHEEIVKSNVGYLLGEMKRHAEEIGKILKIKPNYILFDTLDKVSREVLKGECAIAPEGNIEQYLLSLIKRDLKERGISE